MSELNWTEKDLGPIDAYAYAVENGYFSGTREQWYAMISGATQNASDAEAYAKGTRAGEAVASDDPAYHDNSSYWNDRAGDNAENAEAFANGTRGGEDVDSDDPAYNKNGKYWEGQAKLQKEAAQAAAATASAAYNVNLLAPNYDATATYAVGAHVIYSGGYYECISAITTAEAWTSGHWRQLTVGGEATDLKSALYQNDTMIVNAEIADTNITSYISKSGRINTSGVAGSDDTMSMSDFILIPKGWTLDYQYLRAKTDYNVISFYSSPDESSYTDGVAGQGAGTRISGSKTAQSNIYARICTRTSNISEVIITIKSLTNQRLATVYGMGTNIKGKLSNSGGVLNDGTINTSASSTYTDFLPVFKGWDIAYKGLSMSSTYNIISFYSSNIDSAFVSGIAGQGASNYQDGSYSVPNDGFVRICSRYEPTYVKISPAEINKTFEYIKYVASTGSDTNDGNYPSTPYATIMKAVQEGASKIIVAPGEYTEVVTINNAAYDRVTIYGYGAVFNDSYFEIRNARVEIYGISIDMTNVSGNVSGIFLRNCTAILRDCTITNSPYIGFRLDGSKATLERCKVDTAVLDGFNAHDITANTSEGTFVDCVALNCGDDGLSYHENGKIHVFGGEYGYNTASGIAPHNCCDCEIYNAYIHHNGAGIEIEVGNYELPATLPAAVLVGNILESNTGDAVTAEHYNVKALANGASGNGTDTIVNGGGSTITLFNPIVSNS